MLILSLCNDVLTSWRHDLFMLTITISSLSGGQGKTTTAFFLSRLLAKKGKVLSVDLDPQSNLTFFLRHDVDSESPTALEMLTGSVEVIDSVYQSNWSNLYLIPSDDGLSKAQDYLATSGMGAVVLRNRLQQVADHFDFCVIDSPPARSQISMTTLGAADKILIPAEALTKGVTSLLRTLELIGALTEMGAIKGDILGIIPFRDRWIGGNQAKQSSSAIKAMSDIASDMDLNLFPSILESERFKQALDSSELLHQMGHPNLEIPFNGVLEELWTKVVA